MPRGLSVSRYRRKQLGGELVEPGSYSFIDELSTDVRGAIVGTMNNLRELWAKLPELSGLIARDSFTGKTVWTRRTPWGPIDRKPGPVEEVDCIWFVEWLEHGLDIRATKEAARDSMTSAAEANRVDGLRSYLLGLKWDGVPRIDTWLIRYCGAEETSLNRTFSRRWLVSAAARGLADNERGVKADVCLVLEGLQGIGKSTVASILGGDWSCSTPIDVHEVKEAAIALRGRWIVELAELTGIRKRELESVKAFLSAQTDVVRLPYERSTSELVRRCVFVGTTNEKEYLRDSENRRFWPVVCTRIDVDALVADRDLLFAEAVTAYRAGEHWWLRSTEQESLEALSGLHDEREDPIAADPWVDIVERWLEGREKVTVAEVLTGAIGVETARISLGDASRVGRLLSGALGWKKKVSGRRNKRWYVPPGAT
jgi:putative DNA primase/helicase